MNKNTEVNCYKRKIQKKKPFVLIGNEIDGRLYCDKLFEFKNLIDLRNRLPRVMINIEGEGEWCFELYQVPKEYRIWRRWGYYRYPNRRKKIFKYDYMNLSINKVELFDKEILFIGGVVDNYGISKGDGEIEISRIIIEYN